MYCNITVSVNSCSVVAQAMRVTLCQWKGVMFCLMCKFVNDTELVGLSDMPKLCCYPEGPQQAGEVGWCSLVKFNTCGGTSAPGHAGGTQLESSSAEKELGVLMDTKLNMSQQCTLAALDKVLPADWGCDASHLLSAGEATPGGLSSILGSPVQERHGQSPMKDHEDDEVIGAPLLWGRLRELGQFSLEKGRHRGIPCTTWREGAKRTEPGFFQWLPVPRQEMTDTN